MARPLRPRDYSTSQAKEDTCIKKNYHRQIVKNTLIRCSTPNGDPHRARVSLSLSMYGELDDMVPHPFHTAIHAGTACENPELHLAIVFIAMSRPTTAQRSLSSSNAGQGSSFRSDPIRKILPIVETIISDLTIP